MANIKHIQLEIWKQKQLEARHQQISKAATGNLDSKNNFATIFFTIPLSRTK